MIWSKKCCLVILVVVTVALTLRVPQLAKRPMHGDEAVNAVKFGDLLQEGFYRYNPKEYHGPVLNYFTLIAAWPASAGKLSEIGEFTLRIVPVFFGILLVLMPLLLTRGLGAPAAVLAAAFTAISPAMVFYSRYYIHEMLLVCFTFGVIVCGFRYTQNRKAVWAILTGLFAGLMYATKETCIIALAAMLLSVLLVLMLEQRTLRAITKEFEFSHILAGLATALAVSALLYSSFFTHPAGIADSLRAFGIYLNRASHSTLHIHPWFYYLKMLIYSRYGSGPVWSEGVIIVLAVTGFVAAFIKKYPLDANIPLLRFIALYTFITTVIYSAIGYKTPWCMLTFLHGMIILAAIGAAALMRLCPNLFSRITFGVVLTAVGICLIWQAYQSSYTFCSDVRNPYVYAHTTGDVLKIAERVERMARLHPDGRNMYIQVICPNDDYWPLPWYLRRLGRVGWYDKIDASAPIAPLIIASPAVEAALGRRLYETGSAGSGNLYVPLFERYLELRPTVEIAGFVTKDLLDKFQVVYDDSADK